jgi:hypothetical protein
LFSLKHLAVRLAGQLGVLRYSVWVAILVWFEEAQNSALFPHISMRAHFFKNISSSTKAPRILMPNIMHEKFN